MDRDDPRTHETQDRKLLAVLGALRALVPPETWSLAKAMARHLFAKAGADALAREPVDDLAHTAAEIFRVLTDRRTDEPLVVGFDPPPVPGSRRAPVTVFESRMRDRPFIVDTSLECLRASGCTVRRLLHPIVAVARDRTGTVVGVGAPEALGHKESIVHFEVDRVADRTPILRLLTARLRDVVRATDDYPAMRARAEDIAAELRTRRLPAPWNADADEIAAFLDWLRAKSFVFLGYREYQFQGPPDARSAAIRPGSGLGILRNEQLSAFAATQALPDALRRRLTEPPLLLVSKTNAESLIHRRAHLDYIGIKEIDAAGDVVAERRFVGLLTAKAYADEPTTVPLLRRKLRTILDAEGAAEGSHDYKALVTLFNSVPPIELMASSVANLHALLKSILIAQSTRTIDVQVLLRPDALGRGVFTTVILPRERFSDSVARRTEACVARALSASALLDHHLVIDDSDLARIHFYFATPGPVPATTADDLQRQVSDLLQTWDDRLLDALGERFPEAAAEVLTERYGNAFSSHYKAATTIDAAVGDIRCLEALTATRTPQVDLADDADPHFTLIKLYLIDTDLVLSAFLPVLENLGLTVYGADPMDVQLATVGTVRIHSFRVQHAAGTRLDAERAGALLRPALLLLYAGEIDNDPLNELIASATLEWRQVDLLRTYVNHALQIGLAPSRTAVVQALVRAPATARLLWEYFEAALNPDRPEALDERRLHVLPAIQEQFFASLDTVESAAADRILRALFTAIAATVRTNCFIAATDADRRPDAPSAALAIKFDPHRIAHLPPPHPEHEIYVHGRSVEGIHLRGSDVARGGIRLSDRPDDFRTEVLGLMKTQMVKNAVIIPSGAKGGFVVKPGDDGTPTSNQIVSAYRTFIAALLDVTDNLVRGQIRTPPRVLAYDAADPYLVVAADKGTAAFSDLANQIAIERGFWLGDAFASGGSHGYDHKHEGITARGAWECVRRHFHEMGRDADTDAVSVIGIGDMSGDVFGNGLLLSQNFRLRAAFDHRHIFLDPTPDPERSFAERARLFHVPRSSWADYDVSVLSPGGGIFRRAAKTVPLSAAARDMLGLKQETASGDDVVRAILCMEADLLWNGGIGTYIKATDESHAAVSDSANDAVRVNAADVRALVIGEGGNLGLTQRARIEYAMRGGRLNTDAIDNSGGVDMSDHEVNIKIAVAGDLASGALTLDERNQLLVEVLPAVSRRVLAHNRRQARVLSLDQLRSQTRLADFRDLMTDLERGGTLDRQREQLPDRETLRNRRGRLLGLTRPELAVLLAYSKLALQQALLGSPVPDDRLFESTLYGYFPAPVNERFQAGVLGHRLRREIVAVELANALVDAMGAAFVARVTRDTDASAAAVARAWTIAAMVSEAIEPWREIGTISPPLPVATEVQAWMALESALESGTKWILATQPADEPAGDLHARLAGPTRELFCLLPSVLPATAREAMETTSAALAGGGVPRELAQRVAAMERLATIFETAQISHEMHVPLRIAAEVYHRILDRIDLEWLRRELHALPATDRWERRALEALQETLMSAHRRLARGILRGLADTDVTRHVEAYVAGAPRPWSMVAGLIDDLKNARRMTLAAGMVIMRELGRLVDACA